jgi:hypothetical protein
VQDFDLWRPAIDKLMLKPLPEFLSPQNGLEVTLKQESAKHGLAGHLVALLAPASSRMGVEEGRRDLQLRVAEIRAALVLYQRKNHAYPEKLDQLVPDFLPIVPEDPFTGRPLRYQLTVQIPEDGEGGRRRRAPVNELRQLNDRIADGGWKIWSVGADLKDDGGLIGNPNDPFDGRDYVFVANVPTNEERRRNRFPQPIPAGAIPPALRTEQDFENDLAALREVRWKKEDPVQKNLTWYALREGFAIADAEQKEVRQPVAGLLGEKGFVVSDVAFGKDKVWLGTDRGLFVWDRKEMFWSRFAVGGVLLDVGIETISLTDETVLNVIVHEEGKAPRKFKYEIATAKWAEAR